MTRYGLNGPRIESRLEAKSFADVQTGPGTHLASCAMDIGSFLGLNRRGVALTTHLRLALRLKKEYKYSLFPPSPFMAGYSVNFTFDYQSPAIPHRP